ncbi:MAG: hypothetical protein WC522_02960 [Candidatus Omnitrophota bacterium]
MSIIQDALKKAQRTITPHDRPARDHVILKPPVEKKNTAKAGGNKVPVKAGGKKGTARKYVVPAVLAGLFLFSILIAIFSLALFSNMPKESAEPSAPAQPPAADKQTVEQLVIPKDVSDVPRNEFRLAGIMHLEDGPRAIINNLRVAEGDYVNDAVVTSITDDSVVLKRRNSEITLHLK